MSSFGSDLYDNVSNFGVFMAKVKFFILLFVGILLTIISIQILLKMEMILLAHVVKLSL